MGNKKKINVIVGGAEVGFSTQTAPAITAPATLR